MDEYTKHLIELMREWDALANNLISGTHQLRKREIWDELNKNEGCPIVHSWMESPVRVSINDVLRDFGIVA